VKALRISKALRTELFLGVPMVASSARCVY
jgi:hypothetical protein